LSVHTSFGMGSFTWKATIPVCAVVISMLYSAAVVFKYIDVNHLVRCLGEQGHQ
jgi:hypothetical protein